MAEQHTAKILIAKREFSAFMAAVTELYGPEQAQRSALDWIDELNALDASVVLAGKSCRSITIAAAVRLARRLNSSRTGTKVSAIPSSNCSCRKGLAKSQ